MGFTKVILLFIVITGSTHNTNGMQNKFFRKDYRYLEETDAFYKIHTIPKTWAEGKKICAMEGASLFYPEDKKEADVVNSFWNSTQPFYFAFIGISDSIVKGVFESIDGIPISDIYNNWHPGEPNDAGGNEGCVVWRRDVSTINDDECSKRFPFICKKPLRTVEWNSPCDVPDLAYKYEAALGRCYKFHLTPKTWTEAYEICRAEQSYLAVINSQAEDQHLVKFTEEAPKDKIKGNYLAGAVHLGFHHRFSDEGWQTITGTPLEGSGFSGWSYKQPDGGDNEKCGSMFYNGQLNDIHCETRCFFICEHEIGILSSLIDERLSDAY